MYRAAGPEEAGKANSLPTSQMRWFTRPSESSSDGGEIRRRGSAGLPTYGKSQSPICSGADTIVEAESIASIAAVAKISKISTV